MKKSLALATVASALLVAAPVFAQTADNAGRHSNASDKVDMASCQALMQELQTATAKTNDSYKVAHAKRHLQAGENACLDRDFGTGMDTLKTALYDLAH